MKRLSLHTFFLLTAVLLTTVLMAACNAPLTPLPATAQPQASPTTAPAPTNTPAGSGQPNQPTQASTVQPLPGEDVSLLLAQAIEAKDFTNCAR